MVARWLDDPQREQSGGGVEVPCIPGRGTHLRDRADLSEARVARVPPGRVAPVRPVGVDCEGGRGDTRGVGDRDEERGIRPHLDALEAQLARCSRIPAQVPPKAA